MLNVDEIIEATSGRIVSLVKREFSGISTDTRTISPDEIFLAIKGKNFDGNRFFFDAIRLGSGAILNQYALYTEGFLSNGDIDLKATVITVDDTLKALKDIGNLKRRRFSGNVFAVVGSNGKTTTKEIIASILSQGFNVLKTPNNYNNQIGLPRALSFIDAKTECLVLEMGTNMPNDIKSLCDIALPNIAVITNIGFEHLEGLKSLEGVRDAELEILPYVHTVVANADDGFLMSGLKGDFRIMTFGIHNPDADVRAFDISHKKTGVAFKISYKGEVADINTKLYGDFNVYNCLAGISCGILQGMSFKEIKYGVESFQAVQKRINVFEHDGALIINDSYNANPSSMAEAIKELKRLSKEKKRSIAVLGDMFELGDYSKAKHIEIGKMLKENKIDLFVAVGEMMKYALEEFDNAGFSVSDSTTAADIVLQIIKEGDVVLIKGSRGMQMEKVVSKIMGSD
ncbi:MAG: UDP-N-acetylmuramoyl-tripeptide--D-alanyl-D-alanine ligase [Thermodesulfovibrionales bacterium]|nr:UDP-N-acetylmuramoyl-tripeptide--D-alanyl-D-alanine ligase [Thermodesulfovibrionales bacterium]